MLRYRWGDNDCSQFVEPVRANHLTLLTANKHPVWSGNVSATLLSWARSMVVHIAEENGRWDQIPVQIGLWLNSGSWELLGGARDAAIKWRVQRYRGATRPLREAVLDILMGHGMTIPGLNPCVDLQNMESHFVMQCRLDLLRFVRNQTPYRMADAEWLQASEFMDASLRGDLLRRALPEELHDLVSHPDPIIADALMDRGVQ